MTSTNSSTEAAYRQIAASAVGVRRFANDEIARVGTRLDEDGSSEFEFLCECGSLGCNAFLKLTLAEYGNAAPGSVVGHF